MTSRKVTALTILVLVFVGTAGTGCGPDGTTLSAVAGKTADLPVAKEASLDVGLLLWAPDTSEVSFTSQRSSSSK